LTDRYVAIEKRDDFQDVRRALYRFIFPATIAFVLWYALYVALSTFARDFMSVRIAGNLDIAFFLGLGQFASTFLITGIYIRYVNKRISPTTDHIRQDYQP